MNILKYIRDKFTSTKAARLRDKKYPFIFIVNVAIEHPILKGKPLRKYRIAIDAHDKEHARHRIREGLKFIVGKAVKP